MTCRVVAAVLKNRPSAFAHDDGADALVSAVYCCGVLSGNSTGAHHFWPRRRELLLSHIVSFVALLKCAGFADRAEYEQRALTGASRLLRDSR